MNLFFLFVRGCGAGSFFNSFRTGTNEIAPTVRSEFRSTREKGVTVLVFFTNGPQKKGTGLLYKYEFLPWEPEPIDNIIAAAESYMYS
jgi:hypothetical protein